MGQWVEDSRYPSGWRWDAGAPAADPNPTNIMNAYAGGPSMSRDDLAVPRSVYDPRLGIDGGGRRADPSPILAIDPAHPVEHVDQLGPDDGPAYWIGSEPDVRSTHSVYEPDDYDDRPRPADLGRLSMPGGMAGLVACPNCGTGVHPDRLR